MPPIPTADHKGAIDPRKVHVARVSCHMVFLWVILINTLINISFLFFVFRDLFAALFIFAGYSCGVLFLVIVANFQNRNMSIEVLPECTQPDTALYHEIVALWAVCCQQAGYHTSGAVYVVLPIPYTQFGRIKNFMVQRMLFRSQPPALFIAAKMFDIFSREELIAATYHEAGHLWTIPQVFWYLAKIVSLPTSMTLRIIGQLRGALPFWCKIPKRILHVLECCLHFVTMFAANHADEYGADAYAALNHGTAEHLIVVLERLRSFHKWENLAYMHFTRGEFTLDDEAHQHTHPVVRERVLRLLHLRKNPR